MRHADGRACAERVLRDCTPLLDALERERDSDARARAFLAEQVNRADRYEEWLRAIEANAKTLPSDDPEHGDLLRWWIRRNSTTVGLAQLALEGKSYRGDALAGEEEGGDGTGAGSEPLSAGGKNHVQTPEGRGLTTAGVPEPNADLHSTTDAASGSSLPLTDLRDRITHVVHVVLGDSGWRWMGDPLDQPRPEIVGFERMAEVWDVVTAVMAVIDGERSR